MSQTGTRRGRPKGSGIDDGDRLAAIARLIASNPQLKPTTAIKSLGVSDPSMIRRLRDKYAEVSETLALELTVAGRAAAAGSTPVVAVAANSSSPVQKSAPHAPAAAMPTPVAAPAVAVAAAAAAQSVEPKRTRAVAARSQPAARRVSKPAPAVAADVAKSVARNTDVARNTATTVAPVSAVVPVAAVVATPVVTTASAPIPTKTAARSAGATAKPSREWRQPTVAMTAPVAPPVAAQPTAPPAAPKPKSTTTASKSKSKASTLPASKSAKSAKSTIVTTAADTASATTTSASSKTADVAPVAVVAEPPAPIAACPAGTDHAKLPDTTKVTTPTPPADTAARLETAAAPAATTDRPATPRLPAADDLLVPFLGLGVAALSSAMAAQMSFADSLARTSLFSTVLRQQLAFNQMAMKLLPALKPAVKRGG